MEPSNSHLSLWIAYISMHACVCVHLPECKYLHRELDQMQILLIPKVETKNAARMNM